MGSVRFSWCICAADELPLVCWFAACAWCDVVSCMKCAVLCVVCMSESQYTSIVATCSGLRSRKQASMCRRPVSLLRWVSPLPAF